MSASALVVLNYTMNRIKVNGVLMKFFIIFLDFFNIYGNSATCLPRGRFWGREDYSKISWQVLVINVFCRELVIIPS